MRDPSQEEALRAYNQAADRQEQLQKQSSLAREIAVSREESDCAYAQIRDGYEQVGKQIAANRWSGESDIVHLFVDSVVAKCASIREGIDRSMANQMTLF